ncbi:alginate lyase family protein [Pedobacter sp. P351]|uniref:alginate lyase family protein n=1 Tax=Pedobacter superstes TaxID=3133441 RepID=UPI00309F2412
MKKILKVLCCLAVVSAGACKKDNNAASQEVAEVQSSKEEVARAAAFVHPGILHTAADLSRMKSKVAANAAPWKAGYDKFSADGFSKSTYVPKGYFSTLDRGTTNVNRTAFENDCNAAYHQALMWKITGQGVYRDKALAIIRGWTNANTTFTGKDAQLIIGLAGFKFVNAAEIMRYDNSLLWKAADISKTQAWFLNKWWSWLQPSGAPTGSLDGNWGMAAVKCQLAIAVFASDQTRFNSAVSLMTNGCASILGNIMSSGQETETGRDNGHWQLALGDMAEAAIVGYNNGSDLFAIGNNWLLAGFEYFCKYQLGNTVPYTPWKTCLTANNYPAISPRSTTYRPIFEMVFNHYKSKGISSPYTKQVADMKRPEGSVGGAQATDHPGFGTLFYTK